MAGERVKLVVKPREQCGTKHTRRLRREGFVPGVLYGSGAPRPFFVEERELRRALTGGHGLHAIVDVVLDGQNKEHHAVLKDYQLDPVRDSLMHVDMHEVRLDRPIQTQVGIEVVGEGDSPGVGQGGVVQLVLREVTVEALPMEVPDRIVLDVSPFDLGDSGHVSNLQVPDGVKVLDDPEATVATVALPRVIEVEPEVEEVEAEEAVEGAEEAAEAEEAAAAGEPAAADES
jgi:large subunit ribosomal protein L25